MRRLLLLMLATSIASGCWSAVRGPQPALPNGWPGTPQVTGALYVNEVAVPFANGALGDEIRNALVRTGALDEVFYPVIPTPGPDLALDVRASGSISEAWPWNIPMALVTGYFLFLPAPVAPYFVTYRADCEVVVTRGGDEVARFRAEAKATATYAMAANIADLGRRARAALYRDLANDVAAQLIDLGLAPAPTATASTARP